MTRARYNSSDNTLKEISQMPEPEIGKYWFMFKYDEDVEKYNAHINSLRTISCHPSAQTVWKEGDVLTEGVDYEIRQIPCPYFDHIDDPVEYSTEAFPLVSVNSEDDPYEELLSMIARSSWDRNEIITEAKKQFIVTKRQQLCQ